MSDTAGREIPSTSSSTSLKPPKRFGRQRANSADLESMRSISRSNTHSSIDSTSARPQTQAGNTDHRDKAGNNHSGLSKLLSGSRRRRKKNKQKLGDSPSTTLLGSDNGKELQANRSNESRDGNLATAPSVNDGQSREDNETANLLTDDSDPDPSPLAPRDSDAGFYTTSFPRTKSTEVGKENDTDQRHGDAELADKGIGASESDNTNPGFPKAITYPAPELDVPGDRDEKGRSVSARQRFKDAFSSNNHDKTSGKGSLPAKRSNTLHGSGPPAPPPIRTDLKEAKPQESEGQNSDPKTPPLTALPLTTVTPPTPADRKPKYSSDYTGSPDSIKSPDSLPPGIVVSHAGNMISHRRVRSTSSASHKPSKLSNSVSAMSPTVEESKITGLRAASGNQQNGFFSTMFSAAQNAATTIGSSLNTQPKTRNASQPLTPMTENVPPEDGEGQSTETSDEIKDKERKASAVDTLGTGDLNFSDLDMGMPAGGVISTNEGVVVTKPDEPIDRRRFNTAQQFDEDSAKREDKSASRAVSVAYGKHADESESAIADDGAEVQTNGSRDANGEYTPSGSVADGENDRLRQRSSSVRGRLARRRHRGSSGATTSTVGAIGASVLAMGVAGANPSMPRLTGFAVASKKRNREFHQLFRSVPEDDYLIEDYSCALQREIILAGRIYISEGHICFSSNILGWVTTLVISFDEVVAIEKESTAMVFPNAIAIQTLHARHTFRSLLSRESTYDLMVNIWKINHPALKSSVNGAKVDQGTGDKTEKAEETEGETVDSDDDEVYDEDEEGNQVDGLFDGGEESAHGSERSMPTRGAGLTGSNGATPVSATNPNGDLKGGGKSTATGSADAGFPGPTTHAPTEYNDAAGRYDRVVKEDIIAAPLGKVYSLTFGPESGSFVPKFLVGNQKSSELQFESDKKGLTNESKTRRYSYVKPLPGGIGPKQTRCISTENLDLLDLDKAVLVTLVTQTPDVPSGNVFTTKTKYLLTWAPGNQTKFVMSCMVEWTGKSWLKGPIEKGAFDGQASFGSELLKTINAAVIPSGRTLKSGPKGKNRRKKTEVAIQEAAAASAAAAVVANSEKTSSWGPLEPLHSVLVPLVDIIKPLITSSPALVVFGLLLVILFFRGPSSSSTSSRDVGCPGWSGPQRLAAYEELWRREESDLWNWLEDRVGMDGMSFPTVYQTAGPRAPPNQNRRKLNGKREVAARLSEKRMSNREVAHAIRTTRDRLNVLEEVLGKQNPGPKVDSQIVNDGAMPHEFAKSG